MIFYHSFAGSQNLLFYR